MKIISHRGYWKVSQEKNSEIAFRRSFDLGYGTETDVRDVAGQLVISHDPPSGLEITFDHFLQLARANELPLALNVKADGLTKLILDSVSRASVKNWFVFDMSIPDKRAYLSAGCPVFCRMSEVERSPAWMSECQGVWLDSFGQEWYDAQFLSELLQLGKTVCIVSSELHGRDQHSLWKILQPFTNDSRLMLCTDFPEAATAFFHSS
jgi:glycerophosphoryl diester phosphodiesterase